MPLGTHPNKKRDSVDSRVTRHTPHATQSHATRHPSHAPHSLIMVLKPVLTTVTLHMLTVPHKVSLV